MRRSSSSCVWRSNIDLRLVMSLTLALLKWRSNLSLATSFLWRDTCNASLCVIVLLFFKNRAMPDLTSPCSATLCYTLEYYFAKLHFVLLYFTTFGCNFALLCCATLCTSLLHYTQLNLSLFGCYSALLDHALLRFATLVYAMLISATFGCNYAKLSSALLRFAMLC